MDRVFITHVQFDTDDMPPGYNPVLRVFATEPTDIQHELCQALEFHHGIPVDYVEWEWYDGDSTGVHPQPRG